MRLGRVIGITSVVLLAGCHPSPPKPAAPTDVVALFNDIQTKFAAIPKPDPNASYDLRVQEGQAALKAALQPYNAVLDEAAGFLNSERYPGQYMPASDFVASDPPSKVNPSQLRAAFSKSIMKALASRARLEMATGQSDKALKDFEVAARIVNFSGAEPGSLLGVLVHVACQEILLNSMRASIIDSSPSAAEDRTLAKIATGIEGKPEFLGVAEAEIRQMEREKLKHPKGAQQEINQWKDLSTLLSAKTSDFSKLVALRKKAGKPLSQVDLVSQKSTPAQLLAITFETQRKAVADSRMTAIEFDNLATKDEKGSFPKTLPSISDPFLESGLFAYEVTPTGFTITSTGSKGSFASLASGGVLKLTYPSPKYAAVHL